MKKAMTKAVIFDLDGTLVQTEKLKAISYARAAVELRPGDVGANDVIEIFKEVVGRSRQEVSQFLTQRFQLEEAAMLRAHEFGVSTPWEAFAQIRLGIYEEILADPNTLLTHQWTHNIALLHTLARDGWLLGLATMSHGPQVQRVLNVLGLDDIFDFVATRDDVDKPKPDPEIYVLVARMLKVCPEECLVIEDSLPGVQAAMAAGMAVVAVTTPFTHMAFQNQNLLDRKWIVDEPDRLHAVVAERIEDNSFNRNRRGSGRVQIHD